MEGIQPVDSVSTERLRGELLKLDIRVVKTTLLRYMRQARRQCKPCAHCVSAVMIHLGPVDVAIKDFSQCILMHVYAHSYGSDSRS